MSYIVQSDTYGADFPHFIGSAVVVDLLDVPLIANGLDRTYAHLLLIVVIIPLFLTDEQLVTVTREIRRGFDDLIRSFRGGVYRSGCCSGRSFPRREFVLLCYCSFLSFLLTLTSIRVIFFIQMNLRSNFKK